MYYKHKASGKYVRVLYEAFAAWDSEQQLIVYRELSDGTVWVRSRTEFLDGRFELVADAAIP